MPTALTLDNVTGVKPGTVLRCVQTGNVSVVEQVFQSGGQWIADVRQDGSSVNQTKLFAINFQTEVVSW